MGFAGTKSRKLLYRRIVPAHTKRMSRGGMLTGTYAYAQDYCEGIRLHTPAVRSKCTIQEMKSAKQMNSERSAHTSHICPAQTACCSLRHYSIMSEHHKPKPYVFTRNHMCSLRNGKPDITYTKPCVRIPQPPNPTESVMYKRGSQSWRAHACPKGLLSICLCVCLF